MLIEGKKYVDIKEACKILDLTEAALFQKSFEKYQLTKLKVDNKVYFIKEELLVLLKERQKEARLALNAQRFLMLLLDDYSENKISLKFGFANGSSLQHFLNSKLQNPTTVYKRVLQLAPKLYPEEWELYKKEYYISLGNVVHLESFSSCHPIDL